MPNASQMPSCQSRRGRRPASSWRRSRRRRRSTPEAARATNEPGSRNRAVRREHLGLVLADPGDLRADVPAVEVAAGGRVQVLGVDLLGESGAHVVAAPVHPDDRVAQRLARLVHAHQAVQLRAERQRDDARAVDAGGAPRPRAAERAEPRARILLGPARPRIQHVVALVGDGQHLALHVDQLRAGALRADVDAEHQVAHAGAPAVDREVERVGHVVLLRGRQRRRRPRRSRPAAARAAARPRDAERAGQERVGGHRAQRRDAVVDGGAEAAYSDSPSTGVPGADVVDRVHDRPAVGRAHAADSRAPARRRAPRHPGAARAPRPPSARACPAPGRTTRSRR